MIWTLDFPHLKPSFPRSITQSGAGAITSGSGAVQLNGAVTVPSGSFFFSGDLLSGEPFLGIFCVV